MPTQHPAYNALTASSSLLRTKLYDHIKEWEACDRCPLSETASHVVLGRGDLPCDILFIGEAPGNSENTLGKPFIGQSGKLLQGLIDHCRHRLWRSYKIKWDYRVAITNVLGCIPVKGPSKTTAGYAFRPPTDTEAAACSPRLARFVQLASPKGIVLLGASAKWLGRSTVLSVFPKGKAPPIHECYHPSYLLHVGGVDTRQYKTWMASLTTFLKQLYNNLPTTNG